MNLLHDLSGHAMVGAFLIGVGLFFLIVLSWALPGWFKIKNWPQTTGRIIESEVRWKSMGGDHFPGPQISYRYSVEGREYTNDQVAPIDSCGESTAAAKAKLVPYPVGKEVTVFYDAKNPKVSYLQPGFSLGSFALLVLICCIFIAVGILLCKGVFHR
ncbi:MAG TPA: DUF3592 domain-containing protein [Chthoniobacteraceae bacterium]|nr:DUF3592 domain-containing protein [Chthoniobacteraceae bacterium]